MEITAYEIRRWRRYKNGTTFSGELYHNGIFKCDVIFSTVSILELHDRFILEDLTHKYTLMKTYEYHKP